MNSLMDLGISDDRILVNSAGNKVCRYKVGAKQAWLVKVDKSFDTLQSAVKELSRLHVFVSRFKKMDNYEVPLLEESRSYLLVPAHEALNKQNLLNNRLGLLDLYDAFLFRISVGDQELLQLGVRHELVLMFKQPLVAGPLDWIFTSGDSGISMYLSSDESRVNQWRVYRIVG
jgi:hypothetical protein